MGNPLCRRQQTTFDNPIFEFSQINDGNLHILHF